MIAVKRRNYLWEAYMRMGKRAMAKNAFFIKQVAIAGVVSEPTIRRYLSGVPVRPTSRLRIERGIEAVRLEGIERLFENERPARARATR